MKGEIEMEMSCKNCKNKSFCHYNAIINAGSTMFHKWNAVFWKKVQELFAEHCGRWELDTTIWGG